MEKLTEPVIALIKDAIQKQLEDYITSDDYHNHNYIVYEAVKDLKLNEELSEDFDVTPDEVEEYFEEFIDT